MSDSDYQEIRYAIEAGHTFNPQHITRESMRALLDDYLTYKERVKELEAQNAKLRATLSRYADPDNWCHDGIGARLWGGQYEDGYVIAVEALKDA